MHGEAMSEMHYCPEHGFGTTEEDRWETHMIAFHTEAVVDMLVTRAFQEAIQIAELEKMYRL